MLAEKMRMDKSECHFGMFDEETAERACDILDMMGGQLRDALRADHDAYLVAKQ